MFYEQANEYITWRKLGYACGRAMLLGLLLGLVLDGVLGLYWYAWRPPMVKKIDRSVANLTQAQQEAADAFGPHTVETGLRDLDYYERSLYYQRPAVVKRYENAVLGVPILIVLGSGAFAALMIFLASIGRVRLRESPAEWRARHIIESTSPGVDPRACKREPLTPGPSPSRGEGSK